MALRWEGLLGELLKIRNNLFSNCTTQANVLCANAW